MASKEDNNGGILKNLTTQMQKMQMKNKNNIMIPAWLQECESPFLWHTQEETRIGSYQNITKSLQKLEELQFDEPGHSLYRYIALLNLVLHHYIKGDAKEVWKNMKTIEDLLKKEAASNEEEYQKVKLILDHVVLSTKATQLALDGEEEQAQKIEQKIVPVNVMPGKDRAALYSIKAHFFLFFGYEDGEVIGVDFMKKALGLDPENPEWKYNLAKMMRYQRKKNPFSMEIPREELELLESIVNNYRNVKYLVNLAQAYKESSSQVFRNSRNKPNFFKSELYKTHQEMYNKSLCYYKEALDLEPEDPFILRRVGYGIMYLPKDIADYDLALKCLLKSQELSGNKIVLHLIGTFYHRFGNDNQKALEYFERTAKFRDFVGLCDMVRLKYLMYKDYDPCPDLEEGLKWDLRKDDQTQILDQLVGYYLFIKRDFHKSICYVDQIIAENKHSIYMKSFKSIFVRMYVPINLFEYLANEALLLLNSNSSQDTDSSNSDKRAIEDFIDKLHHIDPKYVEITPDPELINSLHRYSAEIIAKEKLENHEKKQFQNENSSRNPNQVGNRYDHEDRGRDSDSCRGWNVPHKSNLERKGRFCDINQRDQKSRQYNYERRGARLPVANQTRGKNGNEIQHQGLPRNDREHNQKKEKATTKVENWRKN